MRTITKTICDLVVDVTVNLKLLGGSSPLLFLLGGDVNGRLITEILAASDAQPSKATVAESRLSGSLRRIVTVQGVAGSVV